ncbi:glucokinase [Pochonia chlamydosporia 170]|uniref:Phosphotransferase n=1 Tax=Pochonia chlamydosporia 170 TaxID=1380566 RepID=A0A179F0F7_METCM|nr:glucokinase [Pochonia chlamydosporia 170]OAQ58934.1 glucokinase [Pochonia chlamydosporia 170]
MSSVPQSAIPPSVVAEAQQIAHGFDLSTSALRRVTAYFVQQMRVGLETQQQWQLPSYVTKIPQGSEKGRFLAVDLGGTNCRVSIVELYGNAKYSVHQTKHVVPREVRINPSYKPLFGFIAAKIAEFLDTPEERNRRRNENGEDPAHRPAMEYKLGFAFSFTCEQKSIVDGALIQWDKEWDIPSALGRSPCEMLQESIDEMKLPVQVCVLANDSVGALLTHSYTLSRPSAVLAAIIIGTGTNAAYVENVGNIPRLGPATSSGESSSAAVMVINTEWGSFDDELKVLPSTEYDMAADAASTSPGSQMLEKRIAGLYLGEILRRALIRLVEARVFHMNVSTESPLYQLGGIKTSFMSALANVKDDDKTNVLQLVINTLDARNVSIDDCRAIRLLSDAIARRAARLTAASLAAIIIQSGRLPAQHPVPGLSADVTESRKHDSCFHRLLRQISAFIQSTAYAIRRVLWRRQRAESRRTSDSHKPTSICEDPFPSPLETDCIAIGTDGSVINMYPGFISTIRSTLLEIPEVGSEAARVVQLSPTCDGSLVGAALMAHSTTR